MQAVQLLISQLLRSLKNRKKEYSSRREQMISKGTERTTQKICAKRKEKKCLTRKGSIWLEELPKALK
jgi:hypothetical protein